ncbi:DEAD/DEAH box helicase [Thermoflexus sp.]|uniref:DEAD/DEAH box helicase n=1 Tax=Thermoflexus sp. TaxID=1969742 RepID=UPI0026167A7F|nr:DEAD/DEAH box helicase [Thermoflexus sp.]
MSAVEKDVEEIQKVLNHLNASNWTSIPDFRNASFFLNLPALSSNLLRVQIGPKVHTPLPIEAGRILRRLRQRFERDDPGRDLVARFRAEIRSRYAPVRDPNWAQKAQDPRLRAIGDMGGHKGYSDFQVAAWRQILECLDRRDAGVVLVAPTGGGKTEAFLLPLLYWIAERIRQGKDDPHFLVLYPRKALLQDQMERTLHYAVKAQQRIGTVRRLILGLQFEGIRAEQRDTLQNEEIFIQSEFQLLDRCPWCKKQVRLRFRSRQGSVPTLECPSCHEFVAVSLSKHSHRDLRPHILLTTAESLERMYLDWDFRDYLGALDGIVLDEAHIYHGLYGAHIRHLIGRIRDLALQNRGDLLLIASSATISDPGEFGERLLGIPVRVVNAQDFPMEASGVEVFYFLQAPRRGIYREALSTMIQTAMAMGHAVLKDDDRMLIFVHSLDIAGRLRRDLEDAEQRRKLWRIRIDHNDPQVFGFQGAQCPRTTPHVCHVLYLEGECWRGIIGEVSCHQSLRALRSRPLEIQTVTGRTPGSRALTKPVVIATPALDVGIDDPTIRATLHYRPPRTVFEFIQRRGRAGRRPGDLAWTLMVLDQEPSDYFYLVRRHRLIEGSYRLPLNPENPVVQRVHDRLKEARKAIFDRILEKGGSEPEGLWAWLMNILCACPYLSQRYGSSYLNSIRNLRPPEGWERMREWIQRGKEEAQREMGAEWTLPDLRRRILREEILDLFDQAYGAFRRWLDGEIETDKMTEELHRIVEQASAYFKQTILGDFPQEDVELLGKACKVIQNFAKEGREAAQRALQSGRAWLDFFERMGSLFEEPWNRYIAFEIVRRVYQALFFLHEGLGHHRCLSDVDVYVPDAFFEEGRSFFVEVILRGQHVRTEREDLRYLSSLFAPYRLSYRYSEEEMFALETFLLRSSPSDTGDHVRFRPIASGPRRRHPQKGDQTVVHVRRLRVRGVRSDERGNVGLCLNCFRLHDVEQERCGACGGSVRKGRVFLIKTYEEGGIESLKFTSPVASRFECIHDLRVWNVLRGSRVSFRTPEGMERKFYAWLEPPLYYDFQTRGIRWRVPELPDPENRNMALHTAAHVLLKTVAAIVGVREDQLGYLLDPERGSILVYERFEGGAGLSEVFVDTLQRDPLLIYREMVRTAACPIFLAEQKGRLWNSANELLEYLSRKFRLPLEDPVLQDIVSEATAEANYTDPEKEVCSRYDGCPACVQTLICQGEEGISRSIAEQLVAALTRRIPASEWGREGIPGPVIWADEAKGEYVVLVL